MSVSLKWTWVHRSLVCFIASGWISLLLCSLTWADHRPKPGPAFTAPSKQLVARDTGVWFGLYNTYWLSENWGYYGEYHLRRSQFFDQMSKLYLRFGVNYKIALRLRLTLGVVNRYTWSEHPGEPGEEDYVPEYRFWEQLLFSRRALRLKIYHQIRTEQRWRRSTSMEDPKYYYYNRFRYKFLVYGPLIGQLFDKGSLFFCLYNEIFMQAGEKVEFNYFEDNRAYVGIGYGLSNDLHLHLGYMKSFGQLDAFAFRNHDIFRVSLYHRLTLFDGTPEH
ncbi:MAG: DUF2490 domain-containing protein [Myxococcota bacterium]|nr:DUF2490 domain-containing protein [Myxococcota bacterium]